MGWAVGRVPDQGYEDAIVADLPEIRWIDIDYHGYLIVELDADHATVEWWAVDDVLAPNTGQHLQHKIRVNNDGPQRGPPRSTLGLPGPFGRGRGEPVGFPTRCPGLRTCGRWLRDLPQTDVCDGLPARYPAAQPNWRSAGPGPSGASA